MKILRVIFLILVAAMTCGYLIPAVVSSLRRHPDAGSIWLLNILLGWTVIGWLWVLVKSASATYSNVRVQREL
jgi:hypothetical protein